MAKLNAIGPILFKIEVAVVIVPRRLACERSGRCLNTIRPDYRKFRSKEGTSGSAIIPLGG